MTAFLGIDLGSTSIKGASLDLDRGSLGPAVVQPFPEPVTGLPPSHFEVDPRAVVKTTREVVHDLLRSTRDVQGIVVCSQMGGVLLCDEQGVPRTNYLSWRDQRVVDLHPSRDGSYLDELTRRTTRADLAAIGNELRPGSAPSLLFWLRETGRLPQVPVLAMSLGDYVVSQLCESAPVMEPTLALGTLNLKTGELFHDWFERLGFGSVRWPELTTAIRPAGRLSTRSRSESSAIAVYPAVGDQQAALLGAELNLEELSLNISTGSQASLLTPTLQSGDYQTRPYFGGRFLNTITHLPAGRSLNGLVDLLSELALAEGLKLREPWSTISTAVERTDSSDLDVNLAFFAGTLGDRGHIRNIQLRNLTVGKLFRAAFRHMADNYAQCAERLSPDKKWRSVVLSGGLPQKLPSLRQMIAERFAAPIRSVALAEDTLAGLLRLAQLITTSSTLPTDQP
jgi:sugar (pentulose or hexulose) kinase